MKIRVLTFGLLIFFLSAFLFVFKANATHSWGGYHWARTANPFNLNLADNVSSAWDTYLNTTSSDWSVSSVLDTTVVSRTLNKNCKATSGRVEVCNAKYGNNGWLGVASIWISGLHITQGVVKMNDTYFNTPTYNTSAWRNLVMCQEVGHTLGLDHQDENFSNTNLGTCMDYTDDPSGLLKNQLSNEHPNTHDYEELGIIYAHLDSTTTVKNTLSSAKFEVDHDNLSTLGKEIRTSSDKRTSLFERDFGNGNKVFTFVTWADSSHK
jgi:hypothetical protein